MATAPESLIPRLNSRLTVKSEQPLVKVLYRCANPMQSTSPNQTALRLSSGNCSPL